MLLKATLMSLLVGLIHFQFASPQGEYLFWPLTFLSVYNKLYMQLQIPDPIDVSCTLCMALEPCKSSSCPNYKSAICRVHCSPCEAQWYLPFNYPGLEFTTYCSDRPSAGQSQTGRNAICTKLHF